MLYCRQAYCTMQHWHTLVPLQGPGRPGRDRHAARSHHLAWYGNIINGCSRRFCPRPNHRPHTTPPPAERWLGTRATRAGAVRSLSRLHTDTTNVPPAAAAAAASAVSWSLPIRSHPCTALARARARGVATRWTTRATTSIMLGRAAFRPANLSCRGLRTLACTLLLAKNALVVPRYMLYQSLGVRPALGS